MRHLGLRGGTHDGTPLLHLRLRPVFERRSDREHSVHPGERIHQGRRVAEVAGDDHHATLEQGARPGTRRVADHCTHHMPSVQERAHHCTALATGSPKNCHVYGHVPRLPSDSFSPGLHDCRPRLRTPPATFHPTSTADRSLPAAARAGTPTVHRLSHRRLPR